MNLSEYPRRDILENATEVTSIGSCAAEDGVQFQPVAPAATAECEPVILPTPVSDNRKVQTRYSHPPLFCARVPRATVVGKGFVIDAGQTLLLSPQLALGDTALANPRHRTTNANWHSLAETDTASLRQRHVSGRVILLASIGEHIWGHWLLDILPRLFLSRMCGLPKAKVLISCESRVSARELLELSGIAREDIVEYDPASDVVHCEELFVPSLCRSASAIHPILSRMYREFVAANLTTEEPQKLFVSRSGWQTGKRMLLNRREVEARFLDMGFRRVRPETMTPADQIRMFGNASVLAGEAGSGLHNSVLSPEHTKIIAIRNPNFAGVAIQVGICAAMQQSIVILDGEEQKAAEVPGFGDYDLDIRLLDAIESS